MTTLPQKAALQLPRPAGASLPVSIAPHVIMPQGVAAGNMTGADVWRVIRSNSWLILLLLVVSSGAGFGINYWLNKYHPHYTAEGTVVVLDPADALVPAGALLSRAQASPVSLPLEIRQHATMLKNRSLLTQVLQNANSDVRNTAWYNRFPTPEERKQGLIDDLEVTSSPDSKLILVSMTDNDPKSAQIIVQSLVDQYIKNQDERSQDRQYKEHQNLEQEEIAEEGKLKLVNGDISDIQAELNSDGVTGTMNKINAKDLELEELLKELQVLRLQEQTDEGQYQMMISQINGGQDPPEVSDMIYKDPEVQHDREMLDNAELSAAAAANGNMLAGSPQLMGLQKNEQIFAQKLEKSENLARERYKTQVVEALRQKLSTTKGEIEIMGNSIKEINGQMAQLTTWMEQLLQKQSEQEAINTKLKRLNDELEEIATFNVRNDLAGVEWAAQPELPEIPSFPKLAVTLSMAISLGLILALGIAFLREFMDTSIRSPRDISRVGNMNLLGMVPHEDDDPQSAGARLPVVIFEAPHSMMAEQLRQVRTRLQHSSSLDTTRSILITSPSPGDGKSTIACNLACGLALNGRRILLVDANFRRPELHRVFNLSNDQGFSDVLNNLTVFEHAVQETQVPNLFILPSGPKPTNATELVESQLLVDFLERALEEFDHVIFDSGPLLFVSETVGLAPHVDGVVTVVRARVNTRGVLSRMRDTLRQVKAEHLGVVLNAVRAQGGGYYGRNIRTYYEYQNGGGRAA
ncbi:MAG: polysaccharide biosynthesis tyrosine autokinase [Tepidisphaeraceae bacterium]